MPWRVDWIEYYPMDMMLREPKGTFTSLKDLTEAFPPEGKVLYSDDNKRVFYTYGRNLNGGTGTIEGTWVEGE